mmetsp:Transcript_7678/g.25433  ORF Transcript_7678/g.25433 Transcript_7678/m.25433 type:complete len:405 (-) Transcript_7678:183-1397(-)
MLERGRVGLHRRVEVCAVPAPVARDQGCVFDGVGGHARGLPRVVAEVAEINCVRRVRAVRAGAAERAEETSVARLELREHVRAKDERALVLERGERERGCAQRPLRGRRLQVANLRALLPPPLARHIRTPFGGGVREAGGVVKEAAPEGFAKVIGGEGGKGVDETPLVGTRGQRRAQLRLGAVLVRHRPRVGGEVAKVFITQSLARVKRCEDRGSGVCAARERRLNLRPRLPHQIRALVPDCFGDDCVKRGKLHERIHHSRRRQRSDAELGMLHSEKRAKGAGVAPANDDELVLRHRCRRSSRRRGRRRLLPLREDGEDVIHLEKDGCAVRERLLDREILKEFGRERLRGWQAVRHRVTVEPMLRGDDCGAKLRSQLGYEPRRRRTRSCAFAAQNEKDGSSFLE